MRLPLNAIRLPRNYTRVGEAYANNENNPAGRYPISRNNHWHSGIHVNFQSHCLDESRAVFPLTRGKIAAYRISENFRNVRRRNHIFEADYLRLPPWIQQYYTLDTFLAGISPTVQWMRPVTPAPAAQLPRRYRLSLGVPEEHLFEQYTNNFVLLRHDITVVDIGGDAREADGIPYFTLHTNIITPLGSYLRGFDSIANTAPRPLPFYCTYCFRVRAQDGITIWDRAVNTERRNIGHLANGAVFYLTEPECLLNPQRPQGVTYFRLRPQQAGDDPRYINITNADINSIEVSIEHDTSFVFDSLEYYRENPPEIDIGSILGLGHRPPLYRSDHYDVALLFNDVDFMDRQGLEEAPRYLFRPGMNFYVATDNANAPFAAEEVPFDSETLALRATGRTRTGNNETEYIELYYRDGYRYIRSQDAAAHRVNMLEWRNFFRVLGGGANFPADIDGLGFIRNNYDWAADGGNVGETLGDANPGWYDGDRETAATRSIKRSIVCGHPLEWDINLYMGSSQLKQEIMSSYGLLFAGNDDRRYFMEKARAIDIWNGGIGGRSIDGLNNAELAVNNFWFAHPVKFVNHLNNGGMLDRTFNPYAGHRIARRWREPLPDPPVINTVVSNPGFAPKWDDTDDRNTSDLANVRHEGNIFGGYSVPTGLFNNRGAIIHEGVDFRGRVNDEIYSFIYGKVINLGWIPNTNGRAIVIANERDIGIYVLTHLHVNTWNIMRRGSRVEPGDVVAYVGASGAPGGNRNEQHWFNVPGSAPHLHLEYYDIQYDEAADSDVDNPYVNLINEELVFNIELTATTTNTRNRRNPFDHSEEHP